MTDQLPVPRVRYLSWHCRGWRVFRCLLGGLVLSLGWSSGVGADTQTHVFLAGDSTLSIKPVSAWPETGWGMPFAHFFDHTVEVHNHAMNGRSTRSFIAEGRWRAIVDQLSPGDWVFIQFGHNDQSKHKEDRYTPPDTYTANLKRFVSDVRERGAQPLLLTPVTRRYFDDSGKIGETHPVYADRVREVAEHTGALLIDMEAISRERFSAMGEQDSRLRFMHLAEGVHPNYPGGISDDTHFNELGAREVAQWVLEELKRLQHPLAEHLRPPRYPVP